MRKLITTALLLIFVMALSSCRSAGSVRPSPPMCPRLAPVSGAVMQPPETEKKQSRLFFESQPKPTPKSALSNKS